MKYIVAKVRGDNIVSRNVEVEIDEAKLEEALKEALTHQSDLDWDGWGKPDDEFWIDMEFFPDVCYVNEDKRMQLANAVIEELAATRKGARVHNFYLDYDEDSDPHVKAAIKWLRSKGWQYNEDENVCYRKK